MGYEPIDYSDINFWFEHDCSLAYRAFFLSAQNIVAGADLQKSKNIEISALTSVCHRAVDLGPSLSSSESRKFFEKYFCANQILPREAPGLVTGYFEPELRGSRNRSVQYPVAVYKKPEDLVCLIDDRSRAKHNYDYSHMRKTRDGLVPYFTREEIERGALKGLGLELLYLQDVVEAFFMHVQGSGRIVLDSGETVRLTYDGKNGHPYTSIGKHMIERGYLEPDNISLGEIRAWMESNPDRVNEVLWQNQSYIFFREMIGKAAETGPIGAQGVVLTSERSLAVDGSIHALGTPIWVSAPELLNSSGDGFHQLMIAQDVGSAILGPERGDIFWGSGDRAGEIAGQTAHKASFIVLLPKRL